MPFRRGRDTQCTEDPADRGRADPVAGLEQLALDPLVTPGPVLGGEPFGQPGDLRADRWPARPVRAGPLPGDQAAVPAQDGTGRDEPEFFEVRAARLESAAEVWDAVSGERLLEMGHDGAVICIGHERCRHSESTAHVGGYQLPGRGRRGAVRRIVVPVAWKTACCTVRSPVGWAVMPPRCIRRVPCSMSTSTCSLVSDTVSTCRKSAARIPAACARRNCR